LSEHLTPDTVSLFLDGEISHRTRRKVVAHLLHGCASCGQALFPSPVDEAEYEIPVSSAIGKVQRLLAERREVRRWLDDFLKGKPSFMRLPTREKKRIATWGFVEVLLEEVTALRRENPRRMVELAEIAVEATKYFPPLRYPFRQARDLEARAWAELANAYRVADDLDQAEEALYTAFGRFDQGTGDLLLLARLDDLAASLFAARRQFDEVFSCLDEAFAIYTDARDLHAAGRVMISMGLFSGYDGDYEEGIALIHRGLLEIDRDRDPDLVYRAFHNILLFTVELEDYEEARELLTLLRPLIKARAGRVLRMKITDIEGKIAAGLGDLRNAEHLFHKARKAFEGEGLFFKSALAGLDLAALFFRERRTEELQLLIAEMVETFRSLRVEREALAALLILERAIVRDRVSLELIDRVAEARRRAAQAGGRLGLLPFVFLLALWGLLLLELGEFFVNEFTDLQTGGGREVALGSGLLALLPSDAFYGRGDLQSPLFKGAFLAVGAEEKCFQAEAKLIPDLLKVANLEVDFALEEKPEPTVTNREGSLDVAV
jgi:tetratricopeptide (TPR) repeat protein